MLQCYRNATWNLINIFDTFSIFVVPIEQNEKEDGFVESVANLHPFVLSPFYKFKINVIFRKTILDNVTHW